jgi:hypothetical protein
MKSSPQFGVGFRAHAARRQDRASVRVCITGEHREPAAVAAAAGHRHVDASGKGFPIINLRPVVHPFAITWPLDGGPAADEEHGRALPNSTISRRSHHARIFPPCQRRRAGGIAANSVDCRASLGPGVLHHVAIDHFDELVIAVGLVLVAARPSMVAAIIEAATCCDRVIRARVSEPLRPPPDGAFGTGRLATIVRVPGRSLTCLSPGSIWRAVPR